MLSSLPPELLVQIFKSLPNFKAVLALKDADETFGRVWELNTRAILTAQTNSIRYHDDYVLDNGDLGAYHTLLQEPVDLFWVVKTRLLLGRLHSSKASVTARA